MHDRTRESVLRNPVFDEGVRRSKTVALTFDDGPDWWTVDILETLQEYGVKATFFVIGEKLQDPDASELAKRIVAEGHEIGNHTWSHANLSELSNAETCKELADCSTLIYTITGVVPKFYRAPFLKDTPAAKMAGLALGMLSAECDVIAEDWVREDHREITTRVLNGVHAGGSVVLLHDGIPLDRDGRRDATARSVRKIIPTLLNSGYELVTISELYGEGVCSEDVAISAS